jgi:hypothetical protein
MDIGMTIFVLWCLLATVLVVCWYRRDEIKSMKRYIKELERITGHDE